MTPFGFHTTSEEVVDAFANQIEGRTFLITGPSQASIGAHAAVALASKGAGHLILVARNPAKVQPVIDKIRETYSNVSLTFIQCDLTDYDAVRRAADQINSNASFAKIDVVINNAGVMFVKDFTLDKQGNELTFSANHLGHFLLTNLILPKILAAGPGARIVNVSSDAHQLSNVWFDDPTFSLGEKYDGWTAYGQSKTANIHFTIELARRLGERGLYSFAVHPGVIFNTGLAGHISDEDWTSTDLRELGRRNTGEAFDSVGPRKSTTQGAASLLAAALGFASKESNGAYIFDCQVGEARAFATDRENARKLWALSEELLGQGFNP